MFGHASSAECRFNMVIREAKIAFFQWLGSTDQLAAIPRVAKSGLEIL